MIKNEIKKEGKTRACQRREHREYEENGSFVCSRTIEGTVESEIERVFILMFRENAKSLDILDIPFYKNIYQMVITELLPSHSCDHTSIEWKLGSISRSPSFSLSLPPSSMRFYVRLSDTFFHYHRFNSSLTT